MELKNKVVPEYMKRDKGKTKLKEEKNNRKK